MKWARHARNIGETADFEICFKRTSSSSLQGNGVAPVKEEQERLWSERLSGLLRSGASDREGMTKGLADL